jgi:predicted enzyme related to lactoylglutathione lyase
VINGPHTTWCHVSDMDRSLRFYSGVLGLETVRQSPYWSELAVGALRIGLHPGTPRPGLGWMLGLATSDLAALRAAVEASDGRVTEEYHQTPSGVVLTLSDPDGNPIQALQPGSKLADFGL